MMKMLKMMKVHTCKMIQLVLVKSCKKVIKAGRPLVAKSLNINIFYNNIFKNTFHLTKSPFRLLTRWQSPVVCYDNELRIDVLL